MIELLPGGFDNRFATFVRETAAKLRSDAAHSGAMTDYGAGFLEQKLECWLAGLNRQLPKALEAEFKEFSKSIDPDYEVYLKLKKRFEK